MKKLLLAALLCPAVLPHAAAAQSMQPGEWEFNSLMSSPMLPKPQAATVKQCVSKEDAADPTRYAANEQMKDCVVKPGAKSPGSYHWQVTCPAQGLTGDGSVTYTPTTMNAELRMVLNIQGQRTEMSSKVSGRFVGPCRAK